MSFLIECEAVGGVDVLILVLIPVSKRKLMNTIVGGLDVFVCSEGLADLFMN